MARKTKEEQLEKEITEQKAEENVSVSDAVVPAEAAPVAAAEVPLEELPELPEAPELKPVQLPVSKKGRPGLKVRATQVGYYDNHLVQPGEVFILRPRFFLDKDEQPVLDENLNPIMTHTAEQQFSHKWMELVSTKTSVGRPAKDPADLRKPQAFGRATQHEGVI